MIRTSSVEENLKDFQNRIESACRKAGRNSKEVDVVLVTKTVSVERIEEAYSLGVRKFGENRVQEFVSKVTALPKDIEWHFVGHLQTNKVRDLIGRVSLIHSVDSLRLAEEIEKRSAAAELRTSLLIQVNTSGETSKFGVGPGELNRLLREVSNLQHVTVKGLMTIGPLTEDREKIRNSFRLLRYLRDELAANLRGISLPILSMGMSQDFEVAVEEGANLLRIGTAVFGERKDESA